MAYDYSRHWRDLGETSMQGDFDAQGLKTTLEGALGFALERFERLVCVNSLNFRAVRAGDGFAFTVKCLPLWRRKGFDLIALHLREMRGSKAPQRVFEAECPHEFNGHLLLCLAWCEGRGIQPDRLSDEQLVGILDDYVEFSAALQKATHVLPPRPMLRWRDEALAKCTGPWGRWLRPVIEETPVEDCVFRPEKIRVTHGDLHPGNFTICGNHVTGFLDVEGFVGEYPTCDILRYFTFGAEHLKFFERRRRRRMFERFAAAVRHLPYAPDEWRAAIAVSWMEHLNKKLHDRNLGLKETVQLCHSARLYRRFRQLAEANARP